MRIATRTDVDATPADAWAALADFDAIEARFRDRGIEIDRLDPVISTGTRWRGRARVGGRPIAVEAVLSALVPGEGWTIDARGEGLAVRAATRLLAHPVAGTGVEIVIDVAAVSLAGRVALQPLKLARPRLTAKLDRFVADYAAAIAT